MRIPFALAVGPTVCVIACLQIASAAPSPDADKTAFFESHIRPVLVAHCLECHGGDAGEIEGGLSLASPEAWSAGGDSGAAIVPGDPDASLLIAALEYDGLEMPPAGKLPDETIQRFRKWIRDGAVDPRETAAGPLPHKQAMNVEAGRAFWSFQPLAVTSDPPVQAIDWPSGVIDQYLLAAREEKGLPAVDPADPSTLLRRVAFDLTGLPPTTEQLDAFLADPSDAHYRQIVDQMLDSRGYAEHWARHWLDVARYADSNGSDFNATFHHAWRYRDYVIDAVATDKPIQQFIAEQVAGDLMPAESDRDRAEQWIATTFLMLGPKMLSERNKAKLEMDVVDEQIDTIGRAFLGMTLGCARCHDHKFDPIPTRDYYALAAIFRSTKTLEGESQKYVSTWKNVPLPADPEHEAAVAAFQRSEQVLVKQLKQAEANEQKLKDAKSNPTGLVIDDSEAEHEGDWTTSTLFKPFVGKGYSHDNNQSKGERSLTFSAALKPGTYEVRLAYNGGGTRAKQVPVVIAHATETVTVFVDQTQKPPIDKIWVSLGTFEFGKQATVTVSNAETSGYVIVDAIQFVSQDQAEPSDAETDAAFVAQIEQQRSAAKAEVQRLQAALATLREEQPEPLPLGMVVRDAAPVQTYVCVRGEVENRGQQVERGFLQVCGPGEPPQLPADQSGRLELAQWLTDPDHPLPARVFVNRVWMHLMGEGIVRTVDNFGALGEPPSHPELLDRLAIDFMRDDWSLRGLVRQIVLSRTYRLASTFNETAFAIDPENRFLWRANRKRLPAEAIRDTLLWAAGQLDRTPTLHPMAGFGTLISQNVATPTKVSVDSGTRRTLYMPVIRGHVDDLLTVFDFADPDMLVGRRPQTNVPAQALMLLNDPDIKHWSQLIAARTVATEDVSNDAQPDGEHDIAPEPAIATRQRLDRLYRLCLQRSPDSEERMWALAFLAAEADAEVAWSMLAQTLIASTDFRYLD